MKITPGQTIELDGQKVVAREVFRASGVTWVRYTCGSRRDDPSNSRYATRDEWLSWFFFQQAPIAS
jgi:hypothetical protein